MVTVSLPERVRGILEVVGGQGRPLCCQPTGRRRRRSSKSWMHEFIFVEHTEGGESTSTASIVMSALTSAGIAALASGSLGPAAAAAACVPIIIPMSNALLDAGIPIGDEAKKSMAHLMTANSLQLSFGLIEFLTGDIVNGFTHMMMAGVGFYVVKVDGIVLLPSYSVASTVFAGVSALNVLEMFLYKGSINSDLALSENLLKLATLVHPLLYAASAYIAWNLIDQLRNGLLTSANASQIGVAPPLGSPVIMEPTMASQARTPFVGRAFRLDRQEINEESHPDQVRINQ